MDTKNGLTSRLPGVTILLLLAGAWTTWRVCSAARRLGTGRGDPRHGAARHASTN
jgi:hypothetical protein